MKGAMETAPDAGRAGLAVGLLINRASAAVVVKRRRPSQHSVDVSGMGGTGDPPIVFGIESG
jgi:hypothetical protein